MTSLRLSWNHFKNPVMHKHHSLSYTILHYRRVGTTACVGEGEGGFDRKKRNTNARHWYLRLSIFELVCKRFHKPDTVSI